MRRVFVFSILAVIMIVGVSVAAIGWYAVQFLRAATDSAHEATATMQAVNRPCGVMRLPCGTLADVNQTLRTVRGTFGQVEVAANHEDQQLTTLDRQERALFDGLSGTISDARETIRGAQGLTSDVSVTLGGVNDTLGATRTALGAIADDGVSLRKRIDDPQIDALLRSMRGRIDAPQIDALLRNFNTTTAHVASMSGTADQVFTKATKSYLHPSKHRIVRAAHAAEPYVPLTVKTLSCALVPGSCL